MHGNDEVEKRFEARMVALLEQRMDEVGKQQEFRMAVLLEQRIGVGKKIAAFEGRFTRLGKMKTITAGCWCRRQRSVGSSIWIWRDAKRR